MSGYVLSPRAQADLEEIWDYTEQRWNSEQAVGSHVLFYKVTTAGIDVIRILHARMDFGRHL